MKNYYLHTLDGQPAVYVEGQGVCFASFSGRANKLAHSLKQIRAEQNESKKMDTGSGRPGVWKYGYIRVRP